MFKSSLRSVRFNGLKSKVPMKMSIVPNLMSARFYAAAPITKEEVTKRAFEALKTVAALQESKLSIEASFQNDLGLDSLDTVEALVALEEEFDLEIPDKISDNIKTVGEAIDYIYEEEKNL